jgi:hypothetical protein
MNGLWECINAASRGTLRIVDRARTAGKGVGNLRRLRGAFPALVAPLLALVVVSSACSRDASQDEGQEPAVSAVTHLQVPAWLLACDTNLYMVPLNAPVEFRVGPLVFSGRTPVSPPPLLCHLAARKAVVVGTWSALELFSTRDLGHVADYRWADHLGYDSVTYRSNALDIDNQLWMLVSPSDSLQKTQLIRCQWMANGDFAVKVMGAFGGWPYQRIALVTAGNQQWICIPQPKGIVFYDPRTATVKRNVAAPEAFQWADYDPNAGRLALSVLPGWETSVIGVMRATPQRDPSTWTWTQCGNGNSALWSATGMLMYQRGTSQLWSRDVDSGEEELWCALGGEVADLGWHGKLLTRSPDRRLFVASLRERRGRDHIQGDLFLVDVSRREYVRRKSMGFHALALVTQQGQSPKTGTENVPGPRVGGE